jgi:hypothetical protein
MSPRLARLAAVGETLYGETWIGEMSRALGPLHPGKPIKRLQETTVRRWAQEDYPVPEWVDEALIRLLDTQIGLLADLRVNLDWPINEDDH